MTSSTSHEFAAHQTSHVFLAEAMAPPAEIQPRRPWYARAWRGLCSVTHWLFGLASLVVLLSVLATIPILQFLSLGYLLESSGRIIRSGRIRDGFIGVRAAAGLGGIGLGIFLTMLPVRFFSSLWYSSLLLNGESNRTTGLRLVVFALLLLTTIHMAWAIFRGGKLRHFAWPAPVKLWRRVREGGMYDDASLRLMAFFERLRLKHYFSLGVRGFIGAVAWLAFPVTLMAAATKVDDPGFGGLIALVGGLMLAVVLAYLPFLQARLPMTNRFGSQFELHAVRQQFQRAPIAYWFALLLTLALAIPLYILKAELVPREAAWLPSLFFVTFMFPARLAVGWAVSRSEKRDAKRHWFSRWVARLGVLPVVLFYALIVYFTQFTSWYGAWSLYEQHAFLVPVPFLGM